MARSSLPGDSSTVCALSSMFSIKVVSDDSSTTKFAYRAPLFTGHLMNFLVAHSRRSNLHMLEL